jgi:hypothetical protein
MPKSSTTSVNYIGFETWENKPGVWGNSKYPCFANRFLRSLFARMHRISMYTYPLCILSCSWYWFVNSSGIKLAFIFMYLNLSSIEWLQVCWLWNSRGFWMLLDRLFWLWVHLGIRWDYLQLLSVLGWDRPSVGDNRRQFWRMWLFCLVGFVWFHPLSWRKLCLFRPCHQNLVQVSRALYTLLLSRHPAGVDHWLIFHTLWLFLLWQNGRHRWRYVRWLSRRQIGPCCARTRWLPTKWYRAWLVMPQGVLGEAMWILFCDCCILGRASWNSKLARWASFSSCVM